MRIIFWNRRIGLIVTQHGFEINLGRIFTVTELAAVSIAKKVMNEGIDLTISEGLQLEKRQFSAIFSSEDLREGTRAFVEKRTPTFNGK